VFICTIYITGLIALLGVFRNHFLSTVDHVQLIMMIFVPLYLMTVNMLNEGRLGKTMKLETNKSGEVELTKNLRGDESPKVVVETEPKNN
jgi:hypothetical protein